MNTIFKSISRGIQKNKKLFAAFLLLLGIIYWWALPTPLFQDPYAIVLKDESGRLLGARIAGDGQWRFPEMDSIPKKFSQSILTFEDKRFYRHIGIDFLSLLRACYQNLSHWRIVSGGSTISMQVIRLARKGRARNLWNKLIELVLATRLELAYSKADILKLYVAHAPFGGNVVGLEAASWRYYGKSPQLLSWAESALLAVLPNAPSLIHPGKNRAALLKKRNRLLERLWKEQYIDDFEYELAIEEPLPGTPKPMPMIAPHLLDRLASQPGSSVIRSTLDWQLQEYTNKTLERYQHLYAHNKIHNAAAIIMEVQSGKVRSYVGNVPNAGPAHGEQVDIIRAPRSTGSILKPFLYAFAIDNGLITPGSFLKDIPTQINGYQPENYHQSYDGLVPADQALSRSLNIPFVLLLQDYGLEKFYYNLKMLGLTTISKTPDHYGLTLILGGAEGTLEQITAAYAGMARTLVHYNQSNAQYLAQDFHPPVYLAKTNRAYQEEDWRFEAPVLNASSIWSTFTAMQQLERPDTEGEWIRFNSSQLVAWKTGTSFGFRDAWAVGLTSEYVIGVWVGNADGEGRPGLVGVKKAAPILFDLVNNLKGNATFEQPLDDMHAMAVCRTSGQLAARFCPADTLFLPNTSEQSITCSYHQLLNLDSTLQRQVSSECYPVYHMKRQPWLILPPIEASYYQAIHSDYQAVPEWMPECQSSKDYPDIQLIYPQHNANLYIPTDLDGQLSRIVLRAAHRSPEKKIFWHLDKEFIGTTRHFHTLEIAPSPGNHWLTLVDESGDRLQTVFTVHSKNEK